MSKLVESLKDQMRSVFGESFGQNSNPPVQNLSEAVANILGERKRNFAHRQINKDNINRIKKEIQAPDRKSKINKDTISRIKNDIAALDKKHAEKPQPKADTSGGGGSAAGRKVVSKASGGSSTQHNPFRHSPNLGTGPGTPPGFHPVHGKRHHDERKCWHCSCGNVYDKGCNCVGTGATEDCPKGHNKHVKIHKAYRHAYNDMYHAWRRGEGSKATRGRNQR